MNTCESWVLHVCSGGKQGFVKPLCPIGSHRVDGICLCFSENPALEKQDTFVEKLVTQVIKNLQVKISNIHVRYEDDVSAFGGGGESCDDVCSKSPTHLVSLPVFPHR